MRIGIDASVCPTSFQMLKSMECIGHLGIDLKARDDGRHRTEQYLFVDIPEIRWSTGKESSSWL